VLATVTTVLHRPTLFHRPSTAQRGEVTAGPALVVDDDALRHHWKALLAAATSPAERDEINDVFGRAVR